MADGVTALDTQLRRGGARSDIVVGNEDGALFRLRIGRSPELIGWFGGRIDGLAARDLTGDDVADYTFAVEGTISIIDGRSRATLWQSEPVASSWPFTPEVGANDSILVADIDGDGRQEIMVNTGRIGVDIYEVPAPAP